MKDYKECNIKDFESAMRKKDDDVKTLTNEELYILATKFEADAWQLAYAGTSYSNSLRTRSEIRAKSYRDELDRRR